LPPQAVWSENLHYHAGLDNDLPGGAKFASPSL